MLGILDVGESGWKVQRGYTGVPLNKYPDYSRDIFLKFSLARQRRPG